jgi:hypothetical protein
MKNRGGASRACPICKEKRTRDMNKERIAYELKAKVLAEEQGRNAAEWAIEPDRLSREQMLAILKGIEEGDPAVLDRFREPSLSGEWVDDMSPSKLMVEIGFDDDSGQAGDEEAICAVWEQAARDAFWAKIEETLKLHTKED